MNILKKSGAAAAALRQTAASWIALRASKRGSTAVFVAVAVPALILLGGLSVDQSYLTMRASMLRRTAQDAALAGGQYLSTYYTTGSSTTINTAATNTAKLNMPIANYGTVVPTADVVLGTWNSTTKAFTATTTNPTAVKVTALNTVANGNPVNTFFGGAYGKPTVDLANSAVVSYGTGKAFNTIILNDLSMSFSSEIADQRTADLAVLNCVAGAASTTSQIGLVGFTGHSSMLYALGNAVTSSAAMTTYIKNSLNYCGNTGMPACSGSNLAAGIYAATNALVAKGLGNTSSSLIIITDGVPNADAITYAKADGTYPTPTSLLPVCTIACTDANLWTMAQDQAAYAASLGINVSVVYYSGDTSGTTLQTQYYNQLKSLTTSNGVALQAPSAAQIDASFGAFCASMGSAVKMVQ
jgi:Flp pilus assembly protein TadG